MKAFRPKQAGTTENSFDIGINRARLRSPATGGLVIEEAGDDTSSTTVFISPEAPDGEIRFGGSGGTTSLGIIGYVGGSLQLNAGDDTDGGSVVILAGDGTVALGGSIDIQAGLGASTAENGSIRLSTGELELFLDGATGELQVNGDAGTAGQVLKSTGPGTPPEWANSTGSVAGSDTQVQFNDGGAFGASPNFTFVDDSTTSLTITNTSSGSAFLYLGNGGSNIVGTTGTLQLNAPFTDTVAINAGGGLVINTNLTPRLTITDDGDWDLDGNSGSAGDVLTSAGAGSPPVWAPAGGSAVPYFIPAAVSYVVALFQQALFSVPIDIEGTLEVNGLLIQVD